MIVTRGLGSPTLVTRGWGQWGLDTGAEWLSPVGFLEDRYLRGVTTEHPRVVVARLDERRKVKRSKAQAHRARRGRGG